MTESYIITGPVSTVGFTIILCLFDDDPWRSCFVTVNFWLRPGIYALTWRNIHSYCSWVSYSQPWYSSKIIHQIRWGTLIPHSSILRPTSALDLGIYSLTWKNIHFYCSWVSCSQPWSNSKIIRQIRWGTLLPHSSVLRPTSVLDL